MIILKNLFSLSLSLSKKKFQNFANLPHISALNPYFCELSAMFWAWRYVESDFVGLFHYRRVLDFTPRSVFSRIVRAFTPYLFPIRKYHLSERHITRFVADSGADLILPTPLKMRENLCVYRHYAQNHYENDLKIALDYIATHFPQMREDIESVIYANGVSVSYFNMGIWRRDLFNEYCEFMFSVLFGIMDKVPFESYNSHQARVFGFLSERLCNVWFAHKKRTSNVKIAYLKAKSLMPNKKILGAVRDNDCVRYYVGFVRIYKRKIKTFEEERNASLG